MNRDKKEPFDFSKIKIGAGRVLGVMLLMDGEVKGSRVTYDGLEIDDYNREVHGGTPTRRRAP